MEPVYIEEFVDAVPIQIWIDEVDWMRVTETRMEAFMSDPAGLSYTYGKGAGVRQYMSGPYTPRVVKILEEVNAKRGTSLNGCFLNRYDDAHQHLGWHSDDFLEMDHSEPVSVVSFGEAREIWWRSIEDVKNTPSGSPTPYKSQVLAPGSLFEMPAGFQFLFQHRIPKGSRKMGPRVSLTFRKFNHT